MDKFLGTFELEPQKDVNYCEFMEALGTPEIVRNDWKNGPMKRTLTENGDGTYTMDIKHGHNGTLNLQFIFKLDQEKEREGLLGHVKVKFHLEGSELLETITKADGSFKTRHEIHGDEWIMHLDAKGVHAKRTFKKIH